jgi:hypothetical protein
MSAPDREEPVAPVDLEELPRFWMDAARGSTDHWYFDEGVRPWNWVELGEDDARVLWGVLGEFVAFFNARYVERSEHRIPPCWAEHGCLVEEITTLAFARWQAFFSEHSSIGGAQYWHQYSVPGFVDRIGRWLGPDRLERCQQGLHEEAKDTEPASEQRWYERRQSIITQDCRIREVLAATMSPAQRLGSSDTNRIPFLKKRQNREWNEKDGRGDD